MNEIIEFNSKEIIVAIISPLVTLITIYIKYNSYLYNSKLSKLDNIDKISNLIKSIGDDNFTKMDRIIKKDELFYLRTKLWIGGQIREKFLENFEELNLIFGRGKLILVQDYFILENQELNVKSTKNFLKENIFTFIFYGPIFLLYFIIIILFLIFPPNASIFYLIISIIFCILTSLPVIRQIVILKTLDELRDYFNRINFTENIRERENSLVQS